MFGPKTLSDDDVDAIAAYVQYLRRPSDPGGLATGHIGPVSEGAVGWLIGLGLLLGVSRWIGTRTSSLMIAQRTRWSPSDWPIAETRSTASP